MTFPPRKLEPLNSIDVLDVLDAFDVNIEFWTFTVAYINYYNA